MDIDRPDPNVAASQDTQLHGLFRLPPEIRNQVYSELLVTDSAFRLGYVSSVHGLEGTQRLPFVQTPGPVLS
jgi:hypothetical protein